MPKWALGALFSPQLEELRRRARRIGVLTRDSRIEAAPHKTFAQSVSIHCQGHGGV